MVTARPLDSMAIARPLGSSGESLDPLLAAVAAAPLVALTAEEQALLSEIEGAAAEWLSHEEFASRVRDLQSDD